jgi:hypothetical protein
MSSEMKATLSVKAYSWAVHERGSRRHQTRPIPFQTTPAASATAQNNKREADDTEHEKVVKRVAAVQKPNLDEEYARQYERATNILHQLGDDPKEAARKTKSLHVSMKEMAQTSNRMNRTMPLFLHFPGLPLTRIQKKLKLDKEAMNRLTTCQAT